MIILSSLPSAPQGSSDSDICTAGDMAENCVWGPGAGLSKE